MSPAHCSDEQLMAHLDGELNRLSARWVRRHLKTCWQCRARENELEHQALRIARAVVGDTFPGSDRLALATAAFDAWKSQARVHSAPRSHKIQWIAAAACLALAAMASLNRHEPPPPVVQPGNLLAQARQTEETLARQAVYQSLRLEIVARTGERVATRVEVWSDAPRGRFAFEWRRLDGKLKQAVWRPNLQRSVRFDPAQEDGQSSFLQVMAGDADLRRTEDALYRWLKSRALQPVSLAANFAEFAGQDGVSVRLEYVDARTARLTAARQAREVILEIDSATSRPRSLRVSFRGAAGTAEILLVADRFEAVSSDRLRAAVFEPRILSPTGRPLPDAPSLSATAATPALPDFEAREIEVHFLLHRLRVCLRDDITVRRDGYGQLTVRGLVESTARKAEMVTALHGLEGVRLEIETVAEAAARRPRGSVASPLITLGADNSGFALHDRLEAFFSRQAGSDPARRISRFSNEAVSLSADVLAEAWAIERLTRDLPIVHGDPLGLVGQMMEDHQRSLAMRARDLRQLLAPVLPAAPDPAVAVSRPLETAERIDDLVRALFSARPASTLNVESSLERLAGALNSISPNLASEREP